MDRLIYSGACIYISLPVLIFMASWLRPVFAAVFCALLLVSLFFMLKDGPAPTDLRIGRRQLFILLGCLFVLSAWLFFSGHGGFSFQNSDYHDRNAIFRDLINKPWPVVYDFSQVSQVQTDGLNALPSSAVLTYYIAYWLPSALVGKMLGWQAGNVALFIWALFGLIFIVYFIFRILKRVTLRSVFIFIFFSGFDLIGYLWMSKGSFPSLIAHIEWWSGFQYSSITTLLFWVFNQSVVFWLAILLIENMKNSRSLFFLYALLLLYGPFPFLGMFPFVLAKAYEGFPLSTGSKLFDTLKTIPAWVFAGIRRALSFENLAGGISVLVLIYLYFYGNVAAGRYMGFSQKLSPALFLFLLLEVVIWLSITGLVYYKKPVFWLCVVSLFVIPLFQVGIGQDFCMRVSIPALFVLQLFVQKLLIGKVEVKEGTDVNSLRPREIAKNPEIPKIMVKAKPGFSTHIEKNLRLIRVIMSILLLVGAVCPAQEILRSVWSTIPAYAPGREMMLSIGGLLNEWEVPYLRDAGAALIQQSRKGSLAADNKKSLDSVSITTTNFVASQEQNFFYEYLARDPDS
jgi:hypothetical protein